MRVVRLGKCAECNGRIGLAERIREDRRYCVRLEDVVEGQNRFVVLVGKNIEVVPEKEDKKPTKFQ